MKVALKDKYYRIRNYTLGKLDLKKEDIRAAFEPLIAAMAEHDDSRIVKAKAIDLLGNFDNPAYKNLFLKATSDSSYSVAGSALQALSELDSAQALALAKKMRQAPAKGELSAAISAVMIKAGGESDFDAVADNFEKMPTSQNKFEMVMPFTSLLTKVKNTEKFKRGVDLLIQFKETIPQAYRKQTDPYFDNALNGVAAQKEASGMQDQADYIKTKVSGSKKGF